MSELPVSQSHKALVIRDGCLLAVRKSLGDMHFAGLWDLPGGQAEAGEGELEAIVREVWHETGLRISIGQLVSETEFDFPAKKPVRRVQVAAYLAICENEAAALKQGASDYVAEVRWIDFRDLARTKFIPGIRPLIDDFCTKFVD